MVWLRRDTFLDGRDGKRCCWIAMYEGSRNGSWICLIPSLDMCIGQFEMVWDAGVPVSTELLGRTTMGWHKKHDVLSLAGNVSHPFKACAYAGCGVEAHKSDLCLAALVRRYC